MLTLQNFKSLFEFSAYRRIPGYKGILKFHLTPRRLVNFYLAKACLHFGVTYLPTAPWAIDVEPIRACNLACPVCPMSSEKYEKTRLSFERFVEVIEPIAPYLLMIDFSYWGEPLLNPELGKMVRYAKEKKITTIVRTNFNILPDALAEELVQNGCDLLLIGVESPKQENYGRYRVRGSIENIKKNIGKIQTIKKKNGSLYPELYLYGVITEHSAKDEKELSDFAKSMEILGVHRTPNVVDFFLHEEADLLMEKKFQGQVEPLIDLPEDQVLYYYDEKQKLRRKHQHEKCWMPYYYPALSSDGRLNGCWHVFYEKDALVEDRNLSFWEMWNSPKAMRMRRFFRTRKTDPLNPIPCERCTLMSPTQH